MCEWSISFVELLEKISKRRLHTSKISRELVRIGRKEYVPFSQDLLQPITNLLSLRCKATGFGDTGLDSANSEEAEE